MSTSWPAISIAAFADGCLDLVVSNPPYVPAAEEPGLQREVRDYEPPVALYGGRTDSMYIQRLVPEAARVLAPGGWLVMELGYRPVDAVRGMLGAAGTAEVVPDLAGLPRVLAVRLAP